jgi:hypothetical protein
MANAYILKNTRRQAAVKITGTGTANVNLWDVAYSDQTVVPANVILAITDVYYDVANSANIKRNANLVLSVNAGTQMCAFSHTFGVALDEQANANVLVNLGAVEGTMVIQFSKTAGYNDPNRQNQGPGSL